MMGSSDIIAGTSSNNKQDLSDHGDELIHREDPLFHFLKNVQPPASVFTVKSECMTL